MSTQEIKHRPARSPHAWAALVLACAALLSACGGGEQVAGVGTGGTGLASGSVTGFGSVLVDGVAYDDSNALVQRDDGSGQMVNTELRLGQRVALVFDADNKAQTVTVMAQLAGPVSARADSGGWLKVMNQWVRLVPEGDASHSTATVLEGLTSATEIALADEVEVHGHWVYDGTRASFVLVATRLERLTELVNPVLLSGIVQAVGTSQFRLNAPAGSLVQLSGAATPALGKLVRTWVDRASLSASALVGQRVIPASLANSDVAAQTKVLLSGLATNFDPVARTVDVQGTRIHIPAGLGVDEAALSRGEFVSFTLTSQGGNVSASAMNLRSGVGGADLGRTVDLLAVSSGIDWRGGMVRFNLRGVSVSVVQALVPDSCRQAALSADLLIAVRGKAKADGGDLIATQVTCTSISNFGVETVQRTGSVTQVNTNAKTFTLRTAVGDVVVHWDLLTYFSSGFHSRPDSMLGASVVVEGVYVSGNFKAKKVKRASAG